MSFSTNTQQVPVLKDSSFFSIMKTYLFLASQNYFQEIKLIKGEQGI